MKLTTKKVYKLTPDEFVKRMRFPKGFSLEILDYRTSTNIVEIILEKQEVFKDGRFRKA